MQQERQRNILLIGMFFFAGGMAVLSSGYWLVVEAFAVWQQLGGVFFLLSPRPSLEGVLVRNGDYEVQVNAIVQRTATQLC